MICAPKAVLNDYRALSYTEDTVLPRDRGPVLLLGED